MASAAMPAKNATRTAAFECFTQFLPDFISPVPLFRLSIDSGNTQPRRHPVCGLVAVTIPELVDHVGTRRAVRLPCSCHDCAGIHPSSAPGSAASAARLSSFLMPGAPDAEDPASESRAGRRPVRDPADPAPDDRGT